MAWSKNAVRLHRRSRGVSALIILGYLRDIHPRRASTSEISHMLGRTYSPFLRDLLSSMVSEKLISVEVDETVYPCMFLYGVAVPAASSDDF